MQKHTLRRGGGLIAAGLLALAAACGQTPTATDAAAPSATNACDVSATSPGLPFSSPEAADRVEVRLFGPECAQAVAVVSVRRADGALLMARALPYADLIYARPPRGRLDPVSPEDAEAFLAAWATVEVSTTADLPDWSEEAPRPGDDGPLRFSTSLSRDDYLALRAAGSRQICLAEGAEVSVCYVIDPETGRAVQSVWFGS